jgi:hypothetical protein
MNYYICFELISNTCLYNIVFINNLPSHLKTLAPPLCTHQIQHLHVQCAHIKCIPIE